MGWFGSQHVGPHSPRKAIYVRMVCGAVCPSAVMPRDERAKWLTALCPSPHAYMSLLVVQ
jgi:hypothetical protein